MTDISKGRYWDLPWSLVSGCTPCSPGCERCWALGIERRFKKGDGTVHIHPERISIPIRRRKPTVYAIWNDLFHEDAPCDLQRASVRVALAESQHTFLVLTKRPESMARFFEATEINPPGNWWSGLTICNQEEANEKIPVFLRVPGKKFLSIEPMLGPIDLIHSGLRPEWKAPHGDPPLRPLGMNIDAVILGGETGPGARPMHPDLVRSVRDQCAATGVPFFFKSWGAWGRNYLVDDDLNEIPGSEWMDKGIKKPGRLLDGRTHDDLPWRTP